MPDALAETCPCVQRLSTRSPCLRQRPRHPSGSGTQWARGSRWWELSCSVSHSKRSWLRSARRVGGAWRLVGGHWLAEEGSESRRFLLPLLREASGVHMALGGQERWDETTHPFKAADSEVEPCSQEGGGGGSVLGLEVGLLCAEGHV